MNHAQAAAELSYFRGELLRYGAPRTAQESRLLEALAVAILSLHAADPHPRVPKPV